MKKLITIFTLSLLLSPIFAEAKSYNSPSAICKDGTYSYSLNRRGTCSHHKGVSVWLR